MSKVHEKQLLISEAHLDSFGHMNNARYLELFEQARWDVITAGGFGLEVIKRTRTGPTVLEIQLKFLRELGPRESITLRTELIGYERKIGRMRQVMLKSDGTVACEAIIIFGLFHLDQRRLIEPTPEWLHAVGGD
jgi:YbgC/YbaW family acyl-CoA thioester hydrolase